MTDPALFLAACLALLIAPGPTNALMFTAGAGRSLREALRLIAAVLMAYALSIAVARLLLEPALAAVPLLAKGARVAIGLYVLWLAVKLWSSTIRSGGGGVTPLQVFLTTVLNPKGLVLAFVILPPAGNPVAGSVVALAILISICSGLWCLAGAALSKVTGSVGMKLAPRISAITLAAFGSLTLGSAFG